MKQLVISARSISGLVGLLVCYSISIYFFWNSQTSFNDFRIDPENSHFTRLLHSLFGYGGRQGEPNRTIGTIAAFISVHISWSMRYYVGSLVDKFIKKSMNKKTVVDDMHENVSSDQLLKASKEIDIEVISSEKILAI